MPNAPETRHSLLLQLGERSEDAWAEFLHIYEQAIARYCRRLGLQDADAEDATQEVLAAVHARIPTWDHAPDAGSFRAWLFRVARNIAVDAIVARARRAPPAAAENSATEVERELADVEDPRASHAAGLETVYRSSLLDWAAERVRGEVRGSTWRAFELTAVQGHPAEFAAAELGMSVGSVYTAKCRVVARLRARIEGLEFEGPADSANQNERGKS